MKTTELIGAALDWAVSKCEGKTFNLVESFLSYQDEDGMFMYSVDWAQGGPIIEREGITLASPNPIDTDWCAMLWGAQAKQSGTTPLIAAMRCYVASKLGADVEIPKELNK